MVQTWPQLQILVVESLHMFGAKTFNILVRGDEPLIVPISHSSIVAGRVVDQYAIDSIVHICLLDLAFEA
jgi:hypothetical protein